MHTLFDFMNLLLIKSIRVTQIVHILVVETNFWNYAIFKKCLKKLFITSTKNTLHM